MADQTTTNFGFIKPTPSDPGGASTWGVKLNGNFDAIDAALASILASPGHRLSLQPGNPVPSSDVNSTSTVYYTPHRHGYAPVALAGGAKVIKYVGEVSCQLSDTTLSPAAAVANGVYDMFLWNNNGTYVLSRGPAWQSPNTRAATGAIARDGQGFLSNSFDITNGPKSGQGLLVGTVMCDSTGPTCSISFGNATGDSATKAGYVGYQNTFNTVIGATYSVEPAASWSPGTAAAPVNNNTKLRTTLVRGNVEDAVTASLVESWPSGSVNYSGVGLNTITTFSGVSPCITSIGSSSFVMAKFDHDYYLPLGVSFLQALDASPGTGSAQGGPSARTAFRSRFTY
jgi:hypothetical protein